MTVGELIERLKDMPQDADIYAEGEMADTISLEGYDENGNHKEGFAKVVRIFKGWDIDFVCGSANIKEQKNENTN